MQNRRTTELWLLIAAAPVLLLLFAMLVANGGQELSVAAFVVPAALIALFFIAHVVVRKFAPNADPAILPIVFLMAGIGICFVLRLCDDATSLKQVLWLLLGVGCMIATVILLPSVEKLGEYKYTCLLAGLVLLLLPLLPFIGAEYNGSRIWLNFFNVLSFQPGEIAKICIVLFLAAYLADHREMLSTLRRTRAGIKLPDISTLLPLIVMWAVTMLVIIFEKDLGSALLLYGIFLAMLYISTGRLSYVLIGIALLAVGGTALYFVFSHVQVRIAIWLDPFAYATTNGYQLVQSLYSLADGGLFGSGIGKGLCTFIPEVDSDFLFSAIAEETGLLGASGVIILYILFAVRGFATAARAKSDVAAFVSAGLTVAISFQAFIIIGGVTGFIPLTGVTLPFMSQGGSSLLSSFIIVGLLLRAGDEGTGLDTEMTGTIQITRIKAKAADPGILGRVALGKRLTRSITLLVVLFALLIANITVIMVVRADSLQNREANNHTIARMAQRERGAILTSDGVTLAASQLTDNGTYERVYPQGSLAAQLVGYYSQQYGTSGVESTMANTLVGEEHFASFSDVINSMAGLGTTANDVVLTIDSDIQRAAESALAGQAGACVVLDTATGAVLAEASAPTYDINEVSQLLTGSNTSSALLNRVTGALYTPGSTFKIITLAAALDSGRFTADSQVESPAVLHVGTGDVVTHEDSGTISVAEAMSISSNTAFAQIATQLGADTLVRYADDFGFGRTDIAQDFRMLESLMPEPSEMTEWELAWAGSGQPVGRHPSPAGPQVTVMEMALSMAAISNDGVMMRPYVVERVLSSAGATLSTTRTQQLGSAIPAATAQAEQEILRRVVQTGTGYAANISGADVIGKTGTAESGEAVDAWFVGTANAGGRSVTIALVVEDVGPDGNGSNIAAPKAANILTTALRKLGAL